MGNTLPLVLLLVVKADGIVVELCGYRDWLLVIDMILQVRLFFRGERFVQLLAQIFFFPLFI